MYPLRFKQHSHASFNEFHLLSGTRRWLEHSIYDLPLIYLKENQELWAILWHLGITNNECEEHLIIYRSLLNELFKQSALVIFWGKPEGFYRAKMNSCLWKYKYEYFANTHEEELMKHGFLKPPDFVDKANFSDKSLKQMKYWGLFSQKMNWGKMFKTSRSAVSSWNVFYGSNKELKKVLQLLTSPQCPEMPEILNVCQGFIGLHLGEDEGYQDAIIVKTKMDIKTRLNKICQSINVWGQAYEAFLLENKLNSTLNQSLDDWLQPKI